jgi:hypothetical protein
MRFSNKQGGGTQDGFDWTEEKNTCNKDHKVLLCGHDSCEAYEGWKILDIIFS